MNHAYLSILVASEEDRRGLFNTAANRLGIPPQNIEKDFWVCLVLDILFNFNAPGSPRLLFKGGTSLSKAFSLISRFSEDIDITIFREDLDLDLNLDELEKISGKQKRKLFEKLRNASEQYISNQLMPYLVSYFKANLKGEIAGQPSIEIDLSDPSGQTLLIKYPSVYMEQAYVLPTIKIEGGARSALDPHKPVTISPYVSEDVASLNLQVKNVVTINAERTFWDKVIILHGIRRWFDIKGELRQSGHRYSRHYYDVFNLSRNALGKEALTRGDLAIDCARHAKIFFNSSALDLDNAYKGHYSIIPSQKMLVDLKKDYKAMRGMIFGNVPEFDEIVEEISYLQQKLNSVENQ